jgi:rRNA-processing protein FCF1
MSIMLILYRRELIPLRNCKIHDEIIFDSNVFDDVLSGIIKIEQFTIDSIQIFITHIQEDELNECSDKERREKLLNVMREINPIKIATESFVVGSSRIEEAKIGDGDLLEKLRVLNLKRTNDGLIGETAIKNNLVLITNDKQLKNRVNELGGIALSVLEFKAQYEHS